MNFNFGEVLSRAWEIVWKHRVLWTFGILASCGRGGGGGNSAGSGNTGFETQDPTLPPQVQQFLERIAENVTSFIAITIALVCVFWILAIFLSTIGKIGLIRGTWQAEGGADKLIFGQLFSESTPYFWRMFGLSLVVFLPILILISAAVAGLIVFAVSASQGNNDAAALSFLAFLPFFIGCLCLLIPIGFVINMIVRQAERAIVLEDAGVLPSISRGWDIFRNNLGPIIVMAIILAVISLVTGFIIAIPVFLVAIPAVIAFMAGEAQNWTPLIIMGVCLCLYIPVSLLLNGIVIAYAESAWTLTYMRLVRPPEDAPLIIEANA